MKHSAKQEMELAEELLSFANDPLGFVMFAYPWGEEGTPLARVKEPRAWQIETLEALGDHTKEQEVALELGLPLDVFQEADASGRGIGKSALFGMTSNWQISSHIGASVVVTANTEGQLRSKTFPEFNVWYTMAINKHWWNLETMKIAPQAWLKALVEDQLRVGTGYWGVFGAPWSEENPDAFAGVHNSYGLSVFYDEASGIPPAIWDVTEGFFTEQTAYRQWIAFSQGRRNDGRFYDIHHKDSYKKYWRAKRIDARTVEGADQSMYERLIDIHGLHSDVVRVEVLGEFPESSEDQFISVSSVLAAQQRHLPSGVDWTENLYMGVDPAPRGRTAIRFRAGRDGRTIPPVILQGFDNVQIAHKVMELAVKFGVDAIAIDQGLGTGVIDYLKHKHFHRKVPVYAVNFGSSKTQSSEWATVGTELWASVRDWLDTEGCIDQSEELKRDLITRLWKWFGREDNAKILESKKDLAKRGIPSPDDADALALTFRPKLPPKDVRFQRDSGAGRSTLAAGLDENLL